MKPHFPPHTVKRENSENVDPKPTLRRKLTRQETDDQDWTLPSLTLEFFVSIEIIMYN